MIKFILKTIWFMACIFLMQYSVMQAQGLQKGKKVVSQDLPKSSVEKQNNTPRTVLKDTIYKDNTTGKWMRYVEYNEGGKLLKSTTVLPPPVGERMPINVDTMNLDSIVVVVEKELNLVYILYKRKRIRQYRAVFGPDKMVDKHREGDRSTPEGWFKILAIRDHGSWQKFMLLDYPTEESYKRFNERKSQGIIPANSKIGGAIGIHGTFKGGDNMVDMGIGWTDGCVALKSTDIYDLEKFVKKGTRVYITKNSSSSVKSRKKN